MSLLKGCDIEIQETMVKIEKSYVAQALNACSQRGSQPNKKACLPGKRHQSSEDLEERRK